MLKNYKRVRQLGTEKNTLEKSEVNSGIEKVVMIILLSWEKIISIFEIIIQKELFHVTEMFEI